MPDLSTHTVALALGSNIGERLLSLKTAIKELAPYVALSGTSSVYETAAAYVTDQPAFLNAVVLGTTSLEPLVLLRTVKDMENDIGRMPTFRYGPRVIDIDILFYDDLILATPELTLPHSHMAERDFVLRPLSEVAPHWKHPQSGKTASELLALLPDMKMSCLGNVWAAS